MCAKKVIPVTKATGNSGNKDTTKPGNGNDKEKTDNGKGNDPPPPTPEPIDDPLPTSPPEVIMSIVSRFISLLPSNPNENIAGVATLSFYLGDTIMPYIFRGNGSDPQFIFYEGLSVNDQFKPSLNRIDINPSVLAIMITPFKPGDTL